MLLFLLVTAFAMIYNAYYCVYLFKRKRLLSGVGAILCVIILGAAIGIAYQAI